MLDEEREKGLLTKFIKEIFKFSIFLGLLLGAIYLLGYWPLFLQMLDQVKQFGSEFVTLISSVF